MHPDFDPQPILKSETLILRPLAADDLDPLYAVANDHELWAGHPAKNRYKRDVFEPYFASLFAPRETLAVTLADTGQIIGQIIGCSRYYAAPDHPDSISIGFTFLGRPWWGGAYNFEMKRLMLGHAFVHVDEVWLHIGPTNIRSQRATAKLGAVHAYDSEIGPGGNAGLWQCWRLEKSVWQQKIHEKTLSRS